MWNLFVALKKHTQFKLQWLHLKIYGKNHCAIIVKRRFVKNYEAKSITVFNTVTFNKAQMAKKSQY